MGQRKTTIQTGVWSPSWGYSKEASASMALYPTNQNRSVGTNYWITGSTTIPSVSIQFTTASWENVQNNSQLSASIATGSIAKVSIPTNVFTNLYNSNIDGTIVKRLKILNYNGVVSTLTEYNQISSSISNGTTSYFAVLYVSASRASMGNVVTNNPIVDLGTVQNSSNTIKKTFAADGTINEAFEAKYPTNKSDWSLINGKLTSPKNQ